MMTPSAFPMRLTVSAVVLATLVTPLPVVAQDSSKADWTTVPGTRSSRDGAALVLQKGALLTRGAYADFELQFEFRPRKGSTSYLVVRGCVGCVELTGAAAHLPPLRNDGGEDTGYRIALSTRSTDPNAIGRIAGAPGTFKETVLASAPPRTTDDWRRLHVRAHRDTIEVRVDDVLVTRAEQVTRYVGEVGFRVADGRVELRGFQLATIAPPRFPETATDASTASTSTPSKVTPPRPRREVKPVYTREAMQARVQGLVQVEVIVRPDGTVGAARLLSSLHPDLDTAAVAAARAWLFEPALRDGVPIETRVTIELTFTLRD